MDTSEVQVGSTITNGSSALRITERVERDPRWGTPSWRGMCIPLEAFGGNPGTTSTVPDYLLGSWSHVPFEWRRVVGGELEERYVWSADWRRLQREVRPAPGVQPTVNGIRGHLVTTPEQDELRRTLALQDTIGPDAVLRLLTEVGSEVPVDCRAEHGQGHPDCPKCWRWSERNPNRVPRP
jgi:hypothetical protein